ncbi:Fe-S cluster assembly protein SufD [Amphritea atlantica]|uniref:Fe-S cluster assembly protein SufD n=1 Tax=Amphritea atlantica TaxID=355243 RepID=A0ABY5GZ50_9GAMM|nr:Fe-S cluster assembly protein SufD [Amphritea atlantica]
MTMAKRFDELHAYAAPASSGWPWLNAFREQAQQAFAAQELPTLQQETWKYTNIRTLSETAFSDAPPPAGDEQAEAKNARQTQALSLPGHRLTFIAGHFQPQLSQLGDLSGGARLMSLKQALEQEQTLIEAHLGGAVEYSGQPFAALNSARFEDGVLLYLPPGCQLSQPIHCLFYTPSGHHSHACYPRLLIVLEAGAEAQLVEEYLGSTAPQANTAAQFTCPLSEIMLARDTRLLHCKVLRESPQGHHIAGVHVTQAAQSHFHSISVTLGGGISRNDVQISLSDDGAQARLDGLYLLAGRQHLDNHLRIDHLQPGGRSDVLYKGIINDRAHGVFNGMAIVHPGAQQSDARQINKNLLLSENAEIDTKPELQIDADDVKCSHGATVGQLDKDALFYLSSRGLDRQTARALLTTAFAHETLTHLPQGPLREQLTALTGATLTRQAGDQRTSDTAPLW